MALAQHAPCWRIFAIAASNGGDRATVVVLLRRRRKVTALAVALESVRLRVVERGTRGCDEPPPSPSTIVVSRTTR